jgi:hypothetical protein
MNLTAMLCPAAEVVPGSLVASGTVAFKGDQTYMLSLTQTGTVTVSVPATCLMQQGLTLTCEQAAQFIQGAGPPITSAKCTGTSSCTCAFGVSFTSNESGTWAVTGTSLIFTVNGVSEADDFCVQGRELHMMHLQSMMGGATGTPDLVAIKQ